MKYQLIISVSVLLFFSIVYIYWQNSNGNKYIQDFFIVANYQDCQKLEPVSKVKMEIKDALCPRGDVENFMVADNVTYQIQGINGSFYSGIKYALVKVCVEARGQAAWNEGQYKGCSKDPRIIEFNRKLFGWGIELNSLTNMSELISKSGAKPEGYEEFRSNCIKSRASEIFDGNNPNYDCNNAVGSDIEYSIRTHNFVQAGKAH